ncbi:MAG TPA: T9SS type A sorting domain-containing protein [Flavobacteriales bacterium]
MRPLVVLLAASLLTAANAQTLDGPESVEYDPVGDRYFISNTGSGQILQRDQAGVLTTFASSSPAPYGLEIMGDTLFACCGGRVKGFLLVDGAEVFNLNLGGSFLNGITTDGTYLYVTDFSAKKILKIDVADNSFTELVANTVNTPNGIVFDPTLLRLWVAGWGSNALIKSYDPGNGEQLSSFTTNVGSIDGITLDCNGDLLVASWSPNRVTRYESSFTQPAVTVLSSGLSSPADIDYDGVNQRVCIPNSGNDSVTLFDYTACSVDVPELSRDVVPVGPNPTDGLLRFGRTLPAGSRYQVLDLAGAIVATGPVSGGRTVDVSALAPGTYVLDVPTAGLRMRFVRQ